MGLINIFKPLSTPLLPAPAINLGNMEINFRERQESNSGLLGEKQECYLPPPPSSPIFTLKAFKDLFPVAGLGPGSPEVRPEGGEGDRRQDEVGPPESRGCRTQKRFRRTP